MIRKILALLLIFIFSCLNSFAELVVDDSIHSEIASKYQLESLPDLPDNLKNSTVEDIFTPNEFDTQPTSKYTPETQTTKTKEQPSQPMQTTQTTTEPDVSNQNQQVYVLQVNNDTYKESIKIKKGKTFQVVNTQILSDNLKKGSTITFVTTATETNKYITIPKGTVFKGTVIDSHTPELTGNGGLLVIKIDSVIYKNNTYPIEAKITLANDKHVFFENIKGKRMYWKNAKKSTSKGKKFYDKMWSKAKKYFKPGIEIIISPIAFVTGTVVYAANIVASPVLAIFTKGGKLSIPKNSHFEIKMLKDGFINF